MRRFHLAVLACVAPMLVGCQNGVYRSPDVEDGGSGMMEDAGDSGDEGNQVGDGGVVLPDAFAPGSFDMGYPGPGPILYNGGNVIADPLNIYAIFYGDWSYSNGAPEGMKELLSNVGDSKWWSILREYYSSVNLPLPGKFNVGDGGNQVRTYVSGKVNFVSSISVGYPYGKNITDTDMVGLLTAALNNNQLPTDKNGAYVFFTSADVMQTSTEFGAVFCFEYCAYHDHTTINGVDIKWAFIGDPSQQCADSCSNKQIYDYWNIQRSPNNSWSLDMVASETLHELAEIVSDPDYDTSPGWYNDNGENGDLCAYTYGQPFITSNGSVANITIGGKDYMIQQLWDLNLNQGDGGCGMGN